MRARWGEARRSEVNWATPISRSPLYTMTHSERTCSSLAVQCERDTCTAEAGFYFILFFYFLCFTSFLYFLNQLKKVHTCLEPVYDRDCWLEMDGKRTKPEPEGERALKRILDPSLFVCLSVFSSVRPSVPFDLADDLIFKPIFKSCDCRWLSTSYCCSIWLLSTICCCMYLSAGRATSENRSI